MWHSQTLHSHCHYLNIRHQGKYILYFNFKEKTLKTNNFSKCKIILILLLDHWHFLKNIFLVGYPLNNVFQFFPIIITATFLFDLGISFLMWVVWYLSILAFFSWKKQPIFLSSNYYFIIEQFVLTALKWAQINLFTTKLSAETFSIPCNVKYWSLGGLPDAFLCDRCPGFCLKLDSGKKIRTSAWFVVCTICCITCSTWHHLDEFRLYSTSSVGTFIFLGLFLISWLISQ